MKFTTAILGALALAMAAPGAATAEKLSNAVTKELDRLLKVVISGDPVGPPRYGELAPGGVFRFAFEGDRKKEYYFNAICDDDCVNMDLAAFDAAGAELDIDDADDNAPVLNVQADLHESGDDAPKSHPRPMTIEVRMRACKTEACAFGVMITTND